MILSSLPMSINIVHGRCRWGETQSHAPNQPNQIHTTPDTEPRRSRTKPKADLLYLVQQATDTSSIFSNQTSSQSLSPKPSEPNLIKPLSFAPRKLILSYNWNYSCGSLWRPLQMPIQG